VADARADLARRFRLRSLEDLDPAETLPGLDLRAFRDRRHVTLSAGGAEVVVAAGRGTWLFISIIDRARGRIARAFVLRMPELFQGVTAAVEGGAVWAWSEGGAIVEIALADGEVVRFWPGDAIASAGELIDDEVVVPSAGVAWVEARTRGSGASRWRV